MNQNRIPYGSDERVRQLRGNSPSAEVKPSKGHENVLNAIQKQDRVCWVKLLDGEILHGKITGRDKYTVTVAVTEEGETRRLVIFKHAVAYFWSPEAA